MPSSLCLGDELARAAVRELRIECGRTHRANRRRTNATDLYDEGFRGATALVRAEGAVGAGIGAGLDNPVRTVLLSKFAYLLRSNA